MNNYNAKTIGQRILLAVICFFGGWFGLDKFYVGGKKSWKIALIKFGLCFVLLGEIWNCYDIVCAIINKYQINPLID